jgi:DNA-binding IclR family transcriptional regulator
VSCLGRFGARSSDLIIAIALFIGGEEGRPLNPSKLSSYAGVPRPTIIRRIRELQAMGMVERSAGGYVLTNNKRMTGAAAAARKQVMSAAALLRNG